MNLTTALARLLIFPGVLFAVPAAWFFLWVERKSVALMQGRVGPPFMQPFYDFVKLLGKNTPPRSGVGGLLMMAWPLIAVSLIIGNACCVCVSCPCCSWSGIDFLYLR